VIVGILIGLQIDDWNQTRQDRSDEQEFYSQLHQDLLLAEELSSRVRQRRLDRIHSMLAASEVLFNRVDRQALTMEECTGIVWSSGFSITAPGLPSVDELIGTGRMGIIQDSKLRIALVALRQARLALNVTISEKSTSNIFRFLPHSFPDLIQLEASFDDVQDEVSSKPTCDLAAMRNNGHFLTQFSANIDGYDAFLRDGVEPWSSQMQSVHEIVDEALGIEHDLQEGS